MWAIWGRWCAACAQRPAAGRGAVKTKALGTPGSRQDNGYFIASDFSPTMCQLLGMNCAEPTDVTFSFTGFAARGGVTDHHADGFGVALSLIHI